jgi:hypothetical protein
MLCIPLFPEGRSLNESGRVPFAGSLSGCAIISNYSRANQVESYSLLAKITRGNLRWDALESFQSGVDDLFIDRTVLI